MIISISKLRKSIINLLSSKYLDEDAEKICDVIMYAELSGRTSHGLIRSTGSDSSIMASFFTEEVEIEKKNEFAKLVKAHDNCGILALSKATEEAIVTAKQKGFAIVGTNGSHTTSGYLSYYSRRLADEGLISIIMARSDQSIAAFGSKKPIFGTNPISFGFPGLKGHLIFDMATSIISFGDVIKAKAAGKKLPEGLCFDSDGNPTTDPLKVIKDGSILPFDKGYKGSGLAMIVEILAGMFVGAGFGDKNTNNWGNLVIAFKPDLFITIDQFKSNIYNFTKYMKKNTDSRLPGKESYKKYLDHMKAGEIEIDDRFVELLNLNN
jgi:LDH2 family malate/lactate/ureidoglycolate dehydrogenase